MGSKRHPHAQKNTHPARTSAAPYVKGEPTLGDVLSDPVLHAIMASDRINADELNALIQSAQKSLPQN